MIYRYAKLRGRVVEVCGSQAEFARQLGLSERSLSLKMNNKIGFKQSEMERALEVLKLKREELPLYFFEQESS